MALGEFPSLSEINTELSTTNKSLSECINLAGKSGTWTRQSNFSYYGASGSLDLTIMETGAYPFGEDVETEVTASGAWHISDDGGLTISPTSGDGNHNTVTVEVPPNETGSEQQFSIIFVLDSDNAITRTMTIYQDPQ